MIAAAKVPMMKIGVRAQVMPRARIVTMVVIKLTPAIPVENAKVMMQTW
ncbi:unannotated protein [freshwater metagenome]|uniref:Unannotated protein n=1 Tax=freshwater metagenome TaxID=449393 RepID=A0A6J7H3P1_9ZZZZ